MHKSLIDRNISFYLDNVSQCQNEYYVQCKNVLYKGIKYSVGHILCFNHLSSITFAEVKSIWILSRSVYFWCQLNKSEFNEHFQIYEMAVTEDFVMFSTKELKDYYPLNAYQVLNCKEKAVSLHHALDMPI